MTRNERGVVWISARLMGASFVFKFSSYVARSHPLFFCTHAYFGWYIFVGASAPRTVHSVIGFGGLALGTTRLITIFPFPQGFPVDARAVVLPLPSDSDF